MTSDTPSDRIIPRRAALLGAVAALAASLVPTRMPLAQAVVRARVYRTPECGCCLGWVRHLQAHGFATEVESVADLDPIKRRFGVPIDLESCHTAVIEGYVVEGHVPAPAIRALLAVKPPLHGIAVPGMPIGSPGMEGPNPEPYDVVAFDRVGGRWRFMRF